MTKRIFAVFVLLAGSSLAQQTGGGGGVPGGDGGGTVTGVTATSPVTSTGGAAPVIACTTCGVTSSPLNQFATTTSAQLASILSDETGTGVVVFSASPALTGTPTAPTATVGTNTTQLATTAFVLGQVGTATPLVNGTAAVGTSLLYSRQDHVHPTDTSRAAAGPTTFQQASSGTTYYVDSINGLDANNGTSPATAWKTIAHVNAQTFSAGSQVLFLRGDVWHEQLTVPSSGSSGSPITFGNYGSAQQDLPIFDGADPVTGWSVQSGTTYEATFSGTAYKGFVDALYAETSPLVRQTSIANVNSTAGSIYSDGTLVYVHLFDGSNPANHVIEISASAVAGRRYGIFGQDKSYLVISGIKVLRAYDSGISFTQQTDNSGGQAFGSHITVQNSQVFNIGNYNGVQQENAGGGILVTGNIAASQLPLAGWVIQNNYCGTIDWPQVTNNTEGCIQVHNTTGAQIIGNTVSAVNATAIQLRQLFTNTNNDTGNIVRNIITNSQGNISAQGTSSTVTQNTMYNTFGFFVQVGSGTSGAHSIVKQNFGNGMDQTADGSLYNGIDQNDTTFVDIVGNTFLGVAHGCTLDIENSSTNTFVQGNYFDGTAANCVMFITANSLTGLTLVNNTYVEQPGSSTGFHYAGNTESRAAFWAQAVNGGGDLENPIPSYGPTFSVAGCGTATSLTGGGFAGKFTGGSATCTPVVTIGATAAHAFACNAQDQTTSTALFRLTASNTTTATFTAGGVVGATDVISFSCTPY